MALFWQFAKYILLNLATWNGNAAVCWKISNKRRKVKQQNYTM